jgi:hypothetical protein
MFWLIEVFGAAVTEVLIFSASDCLRRAILYQAVF